MRKSINEIVLRDRAADSYDDWYLERGVNAVKSEDLTIMKYLFIEKEDEINILDAGCGTGRFTEKMAQAYPQCKIYALDISSRSLDALRKKQAGIVTGVVDFSKSKLSSLGMPKFQKILSMQMIQHLDKEGAIHAINELYSVLDRDGILVVELYNYASIHRLLERIKSLGRIKKVQDSDLFYEYRYTPNEFKNFVLKYSPFKEVILYGCQNIHRKIINKIGHLIEIDLLISKYIFSKYLGYYFIAICKV